MALEGGGFDVSDRSLKGCADRRVMCTGWAQAADRDLRAARREAREEALRQKKLAVDEAHSTITCPTDGCDAGELCRQVGGWFGGRQAGSVVDDEDRDGAKIWHVRHRMYVERRLLCNCLLVVTASAPEQSEVYPDEEYVF